QCELWCDRRIHTAVGHDPLARHRNGEGGAPSVYGGRERGGDTEWARPGIVRVVHAGLWLCGTAIAHLTYARCEVRTLDYLGFCRSCRDYRGRRGGGADEGELRMVSTLVIIPT